MTVTDSDQPDTAGPYGLAAADYWRAGWRGILPLPARAKSNPPAGFTGANGATPSFPDVMAWLEDPATAAGNLALRLPQHVLGIDVDAYAGKTGDATLTAAIARLGPLPRTWSSSSRADGQSGIYLFRVPEGLAWPGELGPGVELIQYRHRYVVAPPSIHPEGRTYRWRGPGGETGVVAPNVDELPALPPAWIEGLTAGRPAIDTPRALVPVDAAGAWLIGRDRSPAAPCRRVAQVAAQGMTDVAGPGSTHEAARASVMRLVRLAVEGHPGVTGALGQLGHAFVADVTAPGRSGRRTDGQAAHEWQTLVAGAVGLVAAEPTTPAEVPVDPCDNPFAGVVSPHLTAPSGLSSPALHTPLHTPGLRVVDDPDDDAELDPRQLVAGAGMSAGMPSGTGSEAPARERTSWWPRPLADVLAGRTDPTATPAYLARLDGVKLVYPGRTNGLLGESESGKTWLALEAIRQALEAGERVLMLDFEDTAAGTVGRLRALGVPDEALLDLFDYVDPDETLHAQAGLDLAELLADRAPGLIVLDGVNAAMTRFGLTIEDNGDATLFATTFLDKLADSGAAVLTIDHLPKSRENRGKGGIGAQAKRSAMRGAAITVDVISQPAPGKTGKLSLTVDKDRLGAVRAAALATRNVGTAIIASGDDGRVTVTIEPPATAPVNAAGKFRPTVLMERVSAFLGATPGEWVSRNKILQGVGGNSRALVDATDRLVEEGFAERRTGRAGALEHRHVDTFRADAVDLEGVVAPGQAAAVGRYWQQVTTGDEEQIGGDDA